MLAEQATEMAKQTLKDYEDYARKNQVTAVKTVIEYGSPKPIIAKQLPEDNQIDFNHDRRYWSQCRRTNFYWFSL